MSWTGTRVVLSAVNVWGLRPNWHSVLANFGLDPGSKQHFFPIEMRFQGGNADVG